MKELLIVQPSLYTMHLFLQEKEEQSILQPYWECSFLPHVQKNPIQKCSQVYAYLHCILHCIDLINSSHSLFSLTLYNTIFILVLICVFTEFMHTICPMYASERIGSLWQLSYSQYLSLVIKRYINHLIKGWCYFIMKIYEKGNLFLSANTELTHPPKLYIHGELDLVQNCIMTNSFKQATLCSQLITSSITLYQHIV